MRLLLVEDDINKSEQIDNYLSEHFKFISIDKAKSYHSGLKHILQEAYDIIILDMSLPTYDITPEEEGGPFLHYAGEDIMKEMQRRKIPGKVIVMTQFESFGDDNNKITIIELKERLQNDRPEIYTGTIYYEPAGSGWKTELRERINRIASDGGTE